MKKFKWISQDATGGIRKYEKKPKLDADGKYRADGHVEAVTFGLHMNVTPIRINLKKTGYEIKDGILLKLPRDYYNKKTCDLMMRAWRLIIRSETGER